MKFLGFLVQNGKIPPDKNFPKYEVNTSAIPARQKQKTWNQNVRGVPPMPSWGDGTMCDHMVVGPLQPHTFHLPKLLNNNEI